MSGHRANTDRYKDTGNKALNEGRILEAIEEYSKGLEIDSESHILYSNRSAARARNGEYAQALDDAEEVIRIQPKWAKGYSRKGTALQFLGRFDDAKLAFEQGLKLDPENAQLKKGLQECEGELSGPATSQPLGNPFSELDVIMPRLREDHRTKDHVEDPTYLAMLKDLGEDPLRLSNYLHDDRLRLTLSALLGFDLQKPEEMSEDGPLDIPSPGGAPAPKDDISEEDESQIREVDPQKALEQKNLGNECYKNENYAQAVKHYKEAVLYDPTNITLYTNQAAVYLMMGKCKECRDTCFKALEVGKENNVSGEPIAKAYARIGKSFMKESKYDDAIEYLNKSLDEHKIQDTLDKLHECQAMVEDVEREH